MIMRVHSVLPVVLITYCLILPFAHLKAVLFDRSVVHTELGIIRGVTQRFDNTIVNAFLGISFARSPIGSRRFMPPEMITSWEGGLEARKPAQTCYITPDSQFPKFPGAEMWNPPNVFDEDCLALNIWVPINPSGEVMVWIFGGGFFSGSPSLDLYDGRMLASSENVIVVNINYRLGFFGFLYFGEESSVPGNMRLLDQQLALRLIHENIDAFGGDPKRVTLFGESAGGTSATAHLFAPGSFDYFWRLIIMGNLFEKLKSRDFKKDISLFAGSMKDEGIYWLPYYLLGPKMGFQFNHTISADDPINRALIDKYQYTNSLESFIPYFADSQLVKHALLNAYREVSDSSSAHEKLRDGVARFVGDYFFTCDLIHFIDILADDIFGSVYTYYFTERSSANPWPNWMGLMHGYEIEYVFGQPLRHPHMYSRTKLKAEQKFSKIIMKLWANFARFGFPRSDWPKYNKVERESIILDGSITYDNHVSLVDIHGKYCRLLEEDQSSVNPDCNSKMVLTGGVPHLGRTMSLILWLLCVRLPMLL